MPWIRFDFLPQTTHKDVNGAQGDEGAFFPHRVKQLVAGKNASPVPGQVFKKPELADRGEYGHTLHADGHRSDIDFQISQRNDFVTRGIRRNAENVADSRKQLARAEGFGDVSVASGVEGLKAVRFRVLAERKMMGVLPNRSCWRICRQRSKPLILGSMISRRNSAGCAMAAIGTTGAPEKNVETS